MSGPPLRRFASSHAPGPRAEQRCAELALLVYELLDAHGDTMRLGEGLESDVLWGAHLDYLRGLQRVGREALARHPADGEVVLP